MASYLQTWTEGAEGARRYVGEPLVHAASDQYDKMRVAPGDVLYIAYLDAKRLHLISRLRVDRILSRRQAEQHFGEPIWSAARHAIGVGDPAAFDLLVPTDVIRALRFERLTGRETTLAVTDDGEVNGGALQSVRRLSPASAALLDEVFEDEAAPPQPQGRTKPSQAAKKAVELHAMDVVQKHYEAEGWAVEDVSANRPYDLECLRGAEVRHVEVKGLAGPPERIVVTRGEVDYAKGSPGKVALAVVSGIAISDGARPKASGGDLMLQDPWLVDEGRLRATVYSYRLGAGPL